MFNIIDLRKTVNIFVNKFKPEVLENSNIISNQNTINTDLKNKLHEVCLEIEQTKQWFEMETDKNLIDASIHQLMTLKSKYKYLISKLK